MLRLQHMNIGGHIIKPVTVNIQQETNIHKGFIVLFLFFFSVLESSGITLLLIIISRKLLFFKKFQFLTTYLQVSLNCHILRIELWVVIPIFIHVFLWKI